MSDFNLATDGIDIVYDDTVLVSEFDNGSERRREKVDADIIGFNLSSPALTLSEFSQYLDFYKARRSRDSFTYTNPFDGIEYTVRFEKSGFSAKFNAGVFRCSMKFKVII